MLSSTLLSLALSTLALAKYPVELCPSNTPLTCSGSTEALCCFEKDGVVLQTQFWDGDTSLLNKKVRNVGAKSKAKRAADTKFTIHGLWNDRCDGLYDSYCDTSLEISDSKDDIQKVIVDDFGREDLYNTMLEYWVSNESGDAASRSLWEHEYNKHGTCFNTIKPSCFTGDYTKFENAVDYWQKTVEIWETLDTYKFLEEAGITPSADEKYSLSEIQTALKNAHGAEVYVGCEDGAIDEIWYYHHLRGSILSGTLKPIDSLTDSSCPSKVWYLPK